ncbi:hypothetical protein FRC10_005386 [Ceratobasidium sp. 414]|nr:hypothetical protein FRC10_005386 [Ceratobasidium sp. 414]
MAASAAGNESPDKALQLDDLGNIYRSLFERLGHAQDIEMVIKYLKQAVSIIPSDHPDRPGLVVALGRSFVDKYERTGDVSDLEDAIKYHSQAISLVPADPLLLGDLGSLLGNRYRKLGSVNDLDLAIGYQKRAASFIADGHPGQPRLLGRLGGSLVDLFERHGRTSDLDNAINCYNQAVLLTPDGHPDKLRLLRDLGGLHRNRYERIGDVSDLDTALELQNKAASLTPGDYSENPMHLTNTSIVSSGALATAPALDEFLERRGHGRRHPPPDSIGAVPTVDPVPNAMTVHELASTHALLTNITSTMTIAEVILRLGDKGCSNITDQLDPASYSKYPVSTGGFGDVYMGKLRDGRLVAIKTMRLRVKSSQESQKSLKGQIGMVSVWEANGSLRTYLQSHPEADRCQMSTQIADGLSYLHQSGVIHGDLKGPNILISGDDIPLLADFGNSTLQEYTLKFTDTSTKNQATTRWAVRRHIVELVIIFKDLLIQAPELIKGATHSVPSDVYALGMASAPGYN